MEKLCSTWEIKANNKDRIVEFIGSKELVDRDSEIVKVSGIDLKNFKKNPIILLNHNRHDLPIGKAVSVTKSNDQLKLKVEFADKEANPVADMVFRLVKGGFLNAMSIGFTPDWEAVEYPEPKRGKKNQARRIFNKTELLEASVVTVPANQEALATGKSLQKALEDKVISEDEYNSLVIKEEEAEKPEEDEKDSVKETIQNLESEIEVLKSELKTLKEETKYNYIDELFKNYQDTEHKDAKQESNDSLEELYNDIIDERSKKDALINTILNKGE